MIESVCDGHLNYPVNVSYKLKRTSNRSNSKPKRKVVFYPLIFLFAVLQYFAFVWSVCDTSAVAYQSYERESITFDVVD